MSGSTFGSLFRVTNFGESHGPAIGCVIDGCPPGMALSAADIQPELDRRRPGTSRHVTQRNEADAVEILSGVYEGLTTGTPICLLIRNTDQRSKDYGNILDTFRPGHADYTYWRKYGLRDPRGGGRSSARLTAPMVGAGAVARKWLREQHQVSFSGHMTQLGDIVVPFESLDHVAENPFFAANRSDIARLEAYMDRAAQGRRQLRRSDRGRRARRSGRLGRTAVRQARRRDCLRDDGNQRRQGGRDRHRFRLRDRTRHRPRRRDDARRLRQQPFRRRARRHLDRPGHHGLDRDQADQFDPQPAAVDRPQWCRRPSSRPSAATIPVSASARPRSPRRCWRWC